MEFDKEKMLRGEFKQDYTLEKYPARWIGKPRGELWWSVIWSPRTWHKRVWNALDTASCFWDDQLYKNVLSV